MRALIGITTTIPVEVIYAAGHVPVDLNNLLLASRNPSTYLDKAEREGLPRNVCAWTKGIYEVAKARRIRRIVGVVEGDCSYSRAILERWSMDGLEIIPFAYPHDRSRARMQAEIEALAARFRVSWRSILRAKEKLDAIRRKVRALDLLTWREGLVSGEENHFWQVSCSDFRGDPAGFERELDLFLARTSRKKAKRSGIRLGYVGVPPIVRGLYGELEKIGFHVVYNEMQRQFSMPYETGDVVEQYLAYTYPYDIGARLEDITAEVRLRGISALIHYVQSFCHRGIEDYLVRRNVGVPVLTLECDWPGPLDERSRIRLEAFAEMLGRA